MFAKEFRENPALRFCFQLCKDLGIDDPFTWINAVDPIIIDRWAGFYLAEQRPALSNEDPGEVLGKMFAKYFKGSLPDGEG